MEVLKQEYSLRLNKILERYSGIVLEPWKPKNVIPGIPIPFSSPVLCVCTDGIAYEHNFVRSILLAVQIGSRWEKYREEIVSLCKADLSTFREKLPEAIQKNSFGPTFIYGSSCSLIGVFGIN